MKTYKNDVAVLIIFFNRYESLSKVVEQVKIARPRELFLYQDGPRKEKANDMEKILKCRTLFEDIDWDCKIHKFYQTDNYGCDPSEYIAQKWAFSHVEKCIVLEDDDVPSQSFFSFCKELLDKYENDTRINMICGMNTLEKNEEVKDSYFFSHTGSIWGWASWRRVIENWDENYTFLEDEELLHNLRMTCKHKEDFERNYKVAKRHKNNKKAYYESLNGWNAMLNSTMNIIPKYNLITNIGLTEDATHAVSSIKSYPKKIRKVFFMKRYELEGEIVHPKYVFEYVPYRLQVERIFAKRNRIRSFVRKIEVVILMIKHNTTSDFFKNRKK